MQDITESNAKLHCCEFHSFQNGTFIVTLEQRIQFTFQYHLLCKNWILNDSITESNGKICPSCISIILHCCQRKKEMIREINHSVTDLQSLLTLKLGFQNELAVLAIFALILNISENEVDSYRKQLQCQLGNCQFQAQKYRVTWLELFLK